MQAFKIVTLPIELIFGILIHIILCTFSGLIYIFFFASGVFCVAVSGMFEYHFFAGIYSKALLAENDFIKEYLPIFIASGIEIIKVSIVFLKESLVVSGILFARFLLIFVSGACALMVTLHSLDAPNLVKTQSEIKQENTDKTSMAMDKCDMILNHQNAQNDNIKNDKGREKRLTREYDECVKNSATNKQENNNASVGNSISAKDNSILISVLFSIKRFTKGLDDKYYNPEDDYNKNEYNALAAAISVFLTVTLEVVIYIAFRMLSIKHSESINLSGLGDISIDEIGNNHEQASQLVEQLTEYFKKIKELVKEVATFDLFKLPGLLFKRRPAE